MSYETVLFETSDDKVATITLNRPQAANSFNRKMCEEFRDIWERVKIDAKINAVVLRAAPGRAWCTGTDVHALRNTPDDLPPEQRGGVLMYEALWNQVDPGDLLGPKANGCWKPVVAAVHGMACGGAFYWLNESDIVICSEDATFFDPHVTFGMPAVFEPLHLLRRMPLGEVLRLTLLGSAERMSAQRALEIGFASQVVPSAELADVVTWIAESIASAPSLSIQASLRAIWLGTEMTPAQALEIGHALVVAGSSQENLLEGQRAFTSGSRPPWRLR